MNRFTRGLLVHAFICTKQFNEYAIREATLIIKLKNLYKKNMFVHCGFGSKETLYNYF